MGRKIAGSCYIKVDGEQLDVKGSVECPITETVRETKMGLNGPSGYKETARLPYIKLAANLPPGFPRKKLSESTDMTVTAELANGTVYTLSGAYLVGEPAANGEEGEVELEFNGDRGIWQ